MATSKAELLAALRASREEVLGIVRGIPAERLEQGRYENGWNGREILAHLASIEWTYPRLIDVAREAAASRSPAAPAGTAPAAPPTRTMRGGNDDYNARQVKKRAHLSAPELVAEFENNRAATIAAVEATDDRLFSVGIRSAGGVTGALSDVFLQVAVLHVLAHARDIAEPPRA